jgi:uncharacterized protein (UPF0332 family)
MSVPEDAARREVGLYIHHARRMLDVAEHNIADGFCESAINRAYYAIFYAANAMLATQGLTRSKHLGVIAAFRLHFVKPGAIGVEYGDIYGRVMDDRHISDYDVEALIEPERARVDLDDAHRFVNRIEGYLREEGWL